MHVTARRLVFIVNGQRESLRQIDTDSSGERESLRWRDTDSKRERERERDFNSKKGQRMCESERKMVTECK